MSGGGQDGGDGPPAERARKCPICGRASAQETHPFCSRRCADVDLGRWLSGAYIIPGPELDEAPADREDGDYRLS